MSTSLATGIVATEVHAELEQSSTSSSRQPPPAPAAAETAAAEGLTLASTYDRPTRRAQSLSARTPSFHSLSPLVVSPAYNVELSQSVPLCRGRAAWSQRVVSPRARPQRSLSPSQSMFSYGAPSPPISSDIEAEYPAARPSVFRPSLVDIWADADPKPYLRSVAASVDRARPVAASIDVDVRRPGSATPSAVVAHPTRLDVAYARTYGMTSSGIRPTLVGVPSQPGLALPSVIDVVTPRTRVRSDTPMPSSNVCVLMCHVHST